MSQIGWRMTPILDGACKEYQIVITEDKGLHRWEAVLGVGTGAQRSAC